MRTSHSLAASVVLGLLLGLNGGCLSLSMLNREAPDTKQRLDVLEKRVSALEAGAACHCAQPPAAPEPIVQPPGYGFPGNGQR